MPLVFATGPCTLCGQRGGATIVAEPVSNNERITGQFEIVRCAACGTVHLGTRLRADDLTRCYAALADAAPTMPGAGHAAATDRPLKALLRKFWSSGSRGIALEDLVERGPVLDCGCGTGEILQALVARGIDAAGVEFSAASVAHCRALGLTVDEADLDSFVPVPGRYTTIILSHVLEHVADPPGLLRRLATGLARGGSILIVVPHVNSAMRLAFGSGWNGWDAPYHLTHFSRASLAGAARRAGLEVAAMRSVGTADELRRCLIRVTRLRGRMLGLRILATPFFKLFAGLGAGSHLFARLAHG